MVGQKGHRFDPAPWYAGIYITGTFEVLLVTDIHIACPDTGEPVLLPFRMSCYVLSNLVVTAGMLTPGLGVSAGFFSPFV